MTHPATRSGFTPPPSPDAAALDRALDAWVRGDTTALDALDPGMGETVAQLYAWADVAGLPEEEVAVGADASLAPSRFRLRQAAPRATSTLPPSSPVAPDSFDRHPHRPLSRRTRIMTAFSGLAAALVLGLSIYGAVPLITDRDQSPATGTALSVPTQLAASGGSPDGSTPTPGLPLQVGDSMQPTNFVIDPLTAADCPAEARTRADVLGVLSTPPAPGASVYVGNTSVDQSTLEAVNQTLRGWWACMLFGKPWNAMALESDQYLRELFYGDPVVATAFSPSTLDELLRAREEVAATRMGLQPEYGDQWPIVLDVSSAVITPDGVPVRSVEADVYWISAYTGEVASSETLVFEFVWEDGVWRIRAFHPTSGFMPAQR